MPPDYRPLDSFWRRRGYAPGPQPRRQLFPGAISAPRKETAKPLQFWMKALG
jgi:hypothetical protein